jgi:CRP/FNR family transcriptional regulator, cyclic AMP receptor protein
VPRGFIGLMRPPERHPRYVRNTERSEMTLDGPPIFNPRTSLAQPGYGRSIIKYRKNQIIFTQGDNADAIFYIQKGKLKVTVVSASGREAIASLLGPDEFFGEACMAGQVQRLVTVSAMTDVIVVRIEKPEMVRLIQEQWAFSHMFMTHILKRTIRVEADLIDQLFNSSERRLARLLLLLANYGSEGKPEPIISKISQETLAEMIGTTRSRVSFFMNRFRKLGFISYNGHIEVHQSLLNLVLHEQPHIRT